MNDSQHFSLASEPAAIDQWLLSCYSNDRIQTGNQLYQILKDLNQANYDRNSFFDQINKLAPNAIDLATELEQKFFNEFDFIDAKSRKLGRLGLHIIRELITAYHKIATVGTFDQDIFCTSAHKALELIGQHMLISAKISERPSNIYWKLTARLYQKAKENDVLTRSEKTIGSAPLVSSTIQDVLKRNILFSISNPYQLPYSDLDHLFSFLTEQAEMVESEEAISRPIEKSCFVWEYGKASSPTAALQGTIYNPALLINTQNLGSYLQTSKVQLPFNVINAIQDRLTSYQKIIHSDIPSEPKVCQIFSGFEQIAMAMQLQLRKNKILEQGREDLISSSGLINAKLEPLEHESLFINPYYTTDWNSKNSKAQNNTVKLLKTQHINFFISVSAPEKQSLNSLVLIIDEHKKPVLGITRRVLNVPQSNSQRILIEQISGEIDYIEGSEKNNDTAIVIQESDQPIEVFLKPKAYTTGSSLQIKPHHLILEKLTEITPHFMRYQVKPE